MKPASVRFLAVCAVCLLAGCQAMRDEELPEQESVAQIDNRAGELEQAADDAVNRQIAEEVSDTSSSPRQAIGNSAE